MSDQDKTIFNSNEPEPTDSPDRDKQTPPEPTGGGNGQDAPTNNEPALPEELAEFVGEGKKYRDVESALRSIPHAQSHIERLERELEELREKANQARSVDDIIAEIKSAKGQGGQPSDNAIRPEDIEKLVERTITQRERNATAQANTNKVVMTLQNQFGDKAEDTYIQKAQEVGIDVESLNRLCAESPTAALRLLGVEEKKSGGEQRSSASNPTRTEGMDNSSSQNRERRSVMNSRSIREDVDAWRRIGEEVKRKLGVEG